MSAHPAERLPVLATILLAAALNGCVVHLPKNAPGRIDPRRPPEQIACREVQLPEDPGEHQITLSTGILFAGGGSFGRPEGERSTYALSVESTLHFGRRAPSHNANPPLFPLLTDRYYPHRSLGFSLGAQLLEGGSWGPEIGPVYLEVQGFSMKAFASGLAAGWAVHPSDGANGPQVTLFSLGVYVLRFAYLIGRGAQLTFGIQLKLPVTWFWSR